ncbi:signal peptidase II [Myxococcota bacterium]|nr:signal peptidase II [Myxococcota bacterium]
MPQNLLLFAITSALALAGDLLTKGWALRRVPELYDAEVVVPGAVQLVHAQNPGAMVGILAELPGRGPILAAVAALAVVLMALSARQLSTRAWPVVVALGGAAGGALGNALDRLGDGVVFDFVRVYTEHPRIAPLLERALGFAELPAFNLADLFILVGLSVWLVHQVVLGEEPSAAPVTPQTS